MEMYEKTCPKYKTTHLIRSGSMFEDCRADLNLVTFDMYSWTAGTERSWPASLQDFLHPPKS
jgi:hypothetical protein